MNGWRNAVCVGTAWIVVWVGDGACHAGPILDWLFPRRDEPIKAYTAPGAVPAAVPATGATPYTAGYPATGYPGTSYPGASYPGNWPNYAALNPTTARYAPAEGSYAGLPSGPVPPAAPPTGGSCGAGTCYETVMRYLPETSYRTVWAPVPVTQYTTTTSTNPNTGLPITCTRPCTTYSWQARRVPVTGYRPVYQQVPLAEDPAFASRAVAEPVRAFRPFGGLFSRDRRTAAPVVPPPTVGTGLSPYAAPATTLGGVLPPSGPGWSYAPANTYAYAPVPGMTAGGPGTGCSSCGAGANLPPAAAPYGSAPYSAPSYGAAPSGSPADYGSAVPQPDGTVASPWRRREAGGVGSANPDDAYLPGGRNGSDADLEAPRLDPRESRQMVPVTPPAAAGNDPLTPSSTSPFSTPSSNSGSTWPELEPAATAPQQSEAAPRPTGLRALQNRHEFPDRPEFPHRPQPSDVPPLLDDQPQRSVDRTAKYERNANGRETNRNGGNRYSAGQRLIEQDDADQRLASAQRETTSVSRLRYATGEAVPIAWGATAPARRDARMIPPAASSNGPSPTPAVRDGSRRMSEVAPASGWRAP